MALQINWFQRLAESVRTWWSGVPDDRQEGVELGTFRAVSCPTFPKFIMEENLSPMSETRSLPVGNCLNSGTTSPLANSDSPESVQAGADDASEGSFEFVPNVEGKEERISVSPEPLRMESAESCPTEEIVPVEETLAFQFLVRFANRVLPEEFRFIQELDQVVQLCGDGVVPCLLLNSLLMPEMVDVRALNFPTGDVCLTFAEKLENQILCLNSLMSVSTSQQENLKAEALAQGDVDACLSLLWRIIDSATLRRIDVHRFPQLRALQGDHEDIFHFLQRTPEALLLRWVNFTLTQSDNEAATPIQDIGADLSNPKILLKLQSMIQPELNVPTAYKSLFYTKVMFVGF